MTFDEWYDAQPMVLLDRKSEHRLTWEAAQVERDARIAELEERRCEICGYAEHHREHTGCLRVFVNEQVAEIARLKGVLAKCKDALEDSHQNINQERGFASEIEHDIEQALAAIKEEGL